jgi:hypothetical protein
VRRRAFIAGWVAVVSALSVPGAAGADGWSIQPTPNPAGSQASGLVGVSCTRPSACIAVGSAQHSDGIFRALAERWNGSTWEIQPTPNPAGVSFAGFHGVSCTGPRFCVAVGSYRPPSGFEVPLVEHWNGRAWEVVPAPASPDATLNVLYGVSCSGPRFCIAVGEQIVGGDTALPLALRWDGRAWELQPVPIPDGARFTIFGGVSCTGPRACTAVGLYFDANGVPLALAERWDGTRWEIQPTPFRGVVDRQVSLPGVSCPARRACTAVGFVERQEGGILTLAERWNGNTWEIQPSPNPAGDPLASFTDVSCPTARSCIAVGGGRATLAERWDGTAWAIEPTPNPPGATDAVLLGVSCPTRRDCIAVGTYFTSAGIQVTLAEMFTSMH